MYCKHCSPKYNRRGYGNGPRQQELIGLLSGGEHTYTEIKVALDLGKDHTSVLLDRMLNYGLIKRVRRGVYALSDVWYTTAV